MGEGRQNFPGSLSVVCLPSVTHQFSSLAHVQTWPCADDRLSVGSVKVKVTQSYPTLHDPMDCNLPGSSVHGIFQARVLEWVATPLLSSNS